jgi:alpha-tubulin suppressor-like RCC1 family protein/subtilisin-like proprotein convertase family protein
MKKLLSFVLTVCWSYWAQANLIETPVNQPIPDGDLSGLASTINLSGLSDPIGNLQVDLNISGTYNGDLYAYLTHGSGFTVLLNRVGATSGNDLGYGDHGLNVTFANSAPDIHNYQVVLAGNGSLPLTGPLTGTWGPDGRAVSPLTVTDADPRSTFLSSFQGLDPNGQWTLFVADVSGGDLQQLNSWSLEVNNVVSLPEGGNTAALLLVSLAAISLAAAYRSAAGGSKSTRVVLGLVLGVVCTGELLAGQGRSLTTWGSMVLDPSNAEQAIFTSIAAGFTHNLAVRDDGTVVAWGWNGDSQCNVPSGLGAVISVAGGSAHSLTLKADGTVVAWGINDRGQCDVPIGLSQVIAIATSRDQSLALRSDGTVAAWGTYFNGNDWAPATVPDGLGRVTAIVAGANHALALKPDGAVVAWGLNSDGQCDVPSGLSAVVAIAGGFSHSLALKADGTIVAWGLMHPGPGDPVLPTPPEGLSGVVAIAAGESHNLALKSDGMVVAWGIDHNGQTDVPVGLNGVLAISAGGSHSLALKTDGSVVAWGYDWGGAGTAPSGLSEFKAAFSHKSYDQTLAIKVDGTLQGFSPGRGDPPAGLTDVVGVGTGAYFWLVLKADGTVQYWDYSGFTTIYPPNGVSDIVAIAASEFYSIALDASGDVLAWGESIPDLPNGLSGVVAIAGGYAYSLALKLDGTVVAWGDNSSGQCNVPDGLAGVVAIDAGYAHSLALKADGTVVAWGDNSSGQRDVPAGLSRIKAISAGGAHSLALRDDGTVIA